MPLNVEIKARCSNGEQVRAKLVELGADYVGCDHQIDTYFNVPDGRLKLREGNIENNLIFYNRTNQSGPKQSDFYLHPVTSPESLKALLTQAHSVMAIVDKQRHIYYIDNVKFHVDEVSGLGTFVEIEAGDLRKPCTPEFLKDQCDHYVAELQIEKSALIDRSYSDMILEVV